MCTGVTESHLRKTPWKQGVFKTRSGLPHLGIIHFICGRRFHPAAWQNFPWKEAVIPGNYIETPFIGSCSSFCSTSCIWCAFRNVFFSQPEINGLKPLWKGGWIIAVCFRQGRPCWLKTWSTPALTLHGWAWPKKKNMAADLCILVW